MAKPKTSFLYRQSLAFRLGRPAPNAWGSRIGPSLLILFISVVAYTQIRASHEIRGEAIAIVLMSCVNLLLNRRAKPNGVAVTSLEDRADFKFGRSFDELSPEERTQLLLKYQVGTFYLQAAPFGRTVVKPDPQDARSRRYALLVLCLGTLLVTGLHLTYLSWPRVAALQVLGSSRSVVFWTLVFATILPWCVMLLRGPRFVAFKRQRPASLH